MKRRSKSRGAAMVEAAVVMPVMVSFLGMMVYFHSIYQNKQDAMLDARTNMLTYASHACDGQSPPSDNPNLGGDASGAASAGGLSGAMSTVFSVKSQGPTKQHQAQGKYQVARGWTKQMTHTSYCMCNEKTLGASPQALIQFGIGIVKNKAIF